VIFVFALVAIVVVEVVVVAVVVVAAAVVVAVAMVGVGRTVVDIAAVLGKGFVVAVRCKEIAVDIVVLGMNPVDIVDIVVLDTDSVGCRRAAVVVGRIVGTGRLVGIAVAVIAEAVVVIAAKQHKMECHRMMGDGKSQKDCRKDCYWGLGNS